MIRAALLAAALAGPAGAAEIAAVTSQNAGVLTLVDAATLAVVSETPLPGKPAAAAVDGPRGRALAVAVETRRLHVFDAAGRERAAIPCPARLSGWRRIPTPAMRWSPTGRAGCTRSTR